ncbi:MAG: peptide ABC transporter substrate-binding protein [Pyrinomonadaceae bacterium]|nr:peptide ABC transporter substrate-binding protein [Pyrinomonadaceae bacterium]
MKSQAKAANENNRRLAGGLSVRKFTACCCCLLLLFSSACNQLEKPKTEPFYAETAPPQKKEFRWSNGKMPKSFDPGLAAASPETDVIRAVYEGLTDTDPQTLKTIPAIAVEWKSSSDFKVWTFGLRKDARWSNGERVTAKDFVRSWQRLAAMGDKVSRRELLQNIVGLKSAAAEIPLKTLDETENSVIAAPPIFDPSRSLPNYQSNSNSSVVPLPSASPPFAAPPSNEKSVGEKPIEPPFGVTAIDNFTLEVALVKPDKDFPALVAHPIFRPIYGDGKNYAANELNADIVTNGAFRISSVGQDGITLDRAEKYWNKEAVELERVRFVPTENAEKALAAYRAGEVDAVTNADFEPLALKLLTPFEDFRRTTHSAINFYEFNRKMPPFDDRRVREALTIAVERERLTEDEMDGASQPARRFLPFENAAAKEIVEDADRAGNLLAASGFPGGANFPTVKLLVNRNNMQQRIARSVAKMWKRVLNIETEIVVKDAAEIANAWATGEFALLRRGAVLPTANETANILAIFAPPAAELPIVVPDNNSQSQTNRQPDGNSNTNSSVSSELPRTEETPTAAIDKNLISAASEKDETILTEAQAMTELPAIPLYFPTSYSLVKPYIQGFDINILDAPSLKSVKIDNNWQR